ncbi:MAG: NUDIX hydrolase [Puniceicoccales bacterium]|nr:NUDIX hydrolase [Puniceicoccales bacterium]
MNITLDAEVPAWEKLWQKPVYEHEFCTLYESKFRHPIDGREGIFLTNDTCDSVQIVAETIEKKFLLVQQFRFGNEKLSLELPAGRMERGEDIIACAERELLEETGYAGQNAKIIGTLYNSPAIQQNRTYVVHVAECRRTSPTNFDEMEELATLIISRDGLINLIKSGKIESCIALSAIAKFLI